MKFKKSKLIIPILIFTLLAGGFGTYYVLNKKESNSNSVKQINEAQSKVLANHPEIIPPKYDLEDLSVLYSARQNNEADPRKLYNYNFKNNKETPMESKFNLNFTISVDGKYLFKDENNTIYYSKPGELENFQEVIKYKEAFIGDILVPYNQDIVVLSADEINVADLADFTNRKSRIYIHNLSDKTTKLLKESNKLLTLLDIDSANNILFVKEKDILLTTSRLLTIDLKTGELIKDKYIRDLDVIDFKYTYYIDESKNIINKIDLNSDESKVEEFYKSNDKIGLLKISPDKRMLLFQTANSQSDSKLFLYDLTKNEIKELKDYENMDVVYAFWSPDGQYLLITELKDRTYAYSLATSNVKEIDIANYFVIPIGWMVSE